MADPGDLFRAIRELRFDDAAQLLQAGADPRALDANGESTVQALIRAWADRTDARRQAYRQANAPLLQQLHERRRALNAALRQHGPADDAFFLTRGNMGEHRELWAANGLTDTAASFVEDMDDIRDVSEDELFRVEPERAQFHDLLVLLARRGASLLRSGPDGTSPLLLAARRCAWEAIRTLVILGSEDRDLMRRMHAESRDTDPGRNFPWHAHLANQELWDMFAPFLQPSPNLGGFVFLELIEAGIDPILTESEIDAQRAAFGATYILPYEYAPVDPDGMIPIIHQPNDVLARANAARNHAHRELNRVIENIIRAMELTTPVFGCAGWHSQERANARAEILAISNLSPAAQRLHAGRDVLRSDLGFRLYTGTFEDGGRFMQSEISAVREYHGFSTSIIEHFLRCLRHTQDASRQSDQRRGEICLGCAQNVALMQQHVDDARAAAASIETTLHILEGMLQRAEQDRLVGGPGFNDIADGGFYAEFAPPVGLVPTIWFNDGREARFPLWSLTAHENERGDSLRRINEGTRRIILTVLLCLRRLWGQGVIPRIPTELVLMIFELLPARTYFNQ